MSDSAGCITVTIELPEPSVEFRNCTLGLHPLYISTTLRQVVASENLGVGAGLLVEFVLPIQASGTGIALLLSADEILARDRPSRFSP
jgi:hypothetical protein